MITKDIRNQTFDNGTPVQQFLYADSSCGLTQIAIAKKNNFSTNKEFYRKFALTVGDIILGFYKIEDTVPLLQQELGLDPRSAALLGADVLDFLAPLSDPQFVVPTEAVSGNQPQISIQPAAPQLHIQHTPVQPVIVEQTIAAAPLVTPEFRTMASDMARSPERGSYEPIPTADEPVYSSQQPAVRTPLSSLPAYHIQQTPAVPQPTAVPEPPRWSA